MEITPQMIHLLQNSLTNLTAAFETQTTALIIVNCLLAAALWTLVVSGWIWVGKFKSQDNVFKISKAQALFEADKIEQLIAYCQTTAGKYPNCADAQWYLGLAYFHMDHLDTATEIFEALAEKHPNWRDSVDLYLDEIEYRSNGFGSVGSQPMRPN